MKTNGDYISKIHSWTDDGNGSYCAKCDVDYTPKDKGTLCPNNPVFGIERIAELRAQARAKRKADREAANPGKGGGYQIYEIDTRCGYWAEVEVGAKHNLNDSLAICTANLGLFSFAVMANTEIVAILTAGIDHDISDVMTFINSNIVPTI